MRICSKLKVVLPPLPLFVAIALLLVVATAAFGQCSMCRASLAGSNNAFFIRNFNIAVLVLLLPPVTIFCTIFVALKRYRAADEQEENADEEKLNRDDHA
jgi:heme/copper-type cytochrome/quinol oxidase subunit 2